MRSRDLAEDRKGVAMNLQALFMFCFAAIGGAAFAAEPQAASEAAREGLVAVHSWHLDELYLRPNADLAAYRKVLIDPVRAEIRSDWQRNLNYTRNVSRWVGPRDAVTGTLLARVVHLGIAREISRLDRASDVSNRFWFETLFRRWASDCIAEFEAGRNRP